mmetsp:Transcript_8989/g.11932  ORF Transcript_8989/g.11932 Transcript_8989/m.11932 type:complete len:153 (-) Transcript_8989:367-825(-)|eukprot:CAMPEP_0117754320 /NCGR_PEP_ID=MMETSP0947-20121206/12762_1 /TAXON_ID=44440 /ORGANISM="Chattonella subsalsa, Strain CCMP2191" /LENGTH=152 /DNA_ID=CAMNT_0005573393 /DNA_START=64 /DNA_END=522 /DNA_ORIENTATION=+
MKTDDFQFEDGKESDIPISGSIMERAVVYFLAEVQPELDNFTAEKAQLFEGISEEEVNGDDNKVEYYEVYQDFISIFEEKMGVFLSDKGYTTKQFISAVEDAIMEDKDGKESFGTVFVELMEAISGYPKFLNYMREESEMSSKYDGESKSHK